MELGHNVRNIINAKHQTTKGQPNLFFVDSEPAENKRELYNINRLQNKIIQIEPPGVNKNNIIQCVRCQHYPLKIIL